MKRYSEGPEIPDIRYMLLSFTKLPPAHTQCKEPADSTGKQVFFKTEQIKKAFYFFDDQRKVCPESVLNPSKNNGYL